MSEHTSSFIRRRRVKSISFKLNSKSFEFENILTMNHYNTF